MDPHKIWFVIGVTILVSEWKHVQISPQQQGHNCFLSFYFRRSACVNRTILGQSIGSGLRQLKSNQFLLIAAPPIWLLNFLYFLL